MSLPDPEGLFPRGFPRTAGLADFCRTATRLLIQGEDIGLVRRAVCYLCRDFYVNVGPETVNKAVDHIMATAQRRATQP